MKEARFADWQRRLGTQALAWPIKLQRFAFDSIPTLGSGEFPFLSPITALSGPNGVGKTTLLRALWHALCASTDDRASKHDRKLISGRASIDLTVGEESFKGEVLFSTEEIQTVSKVNIPIMHIDAASEASLYQEQFCEFSSSEDIINGAGARELDQDDLAEVSYILNRDYRAITLYEVELGDTVPFFEVAYGDDRYDSRTMGSGEISALHIWWKLSQAESGSLALVEEPEAFLSYRCQVNIGKHLVYKAVKNRICVVVSTHSAPILSLLPKESLRFFVRSQAGVQVVVDPVPPSLLKSVGIKPPLAAILLVEDAAGAEFAKLILERFDPSFSRRVTFNVRNGEGEITTALRQTLFHTDYPKFLGLYDGDMKGSVPEDVASRSALLPGNQRIERVYRQLINDDPGVLSEFIAVDRLNVILASLEGAEDHDWFEGLSKEFGLSRQQIFPILFNKWVAKEDNNNDAFKSYESLVALISGRLSQELSVT